MSTLEKVILRMLDTNQPKNVRDLVHLVQNEVDIPPEKIEEEVKNLYKKGMVILEEPKTNKEFLNFISLKSESTRQVLSTRSLLKLNPSPILFKSSTNSCIISRASFPPTLQ